MIVLNSALQLPNYFAVMNLEKKQKKKKKKKEKNKTPYWHQQNLIIKENYL